MMSPRDLVTALVPWREDKERWICQKLIHEFADSQNQPGAAHGF